MQQGEQKLLLVIANGFQTSWAKLNSCSTLVSPSASVNGTWTLVLSVMAESAHPCVAFLPIMAFQHHQIHGEAIIFFFPLSFATSGADHFSRQSPNLMDW